MSAIGSLGPRPLLAHLTLGEAVTNGVVGGSSATGAHRTPG